MKAVRAGLYLPVEIFFSLIVATIVGLLVVALSDLSVTWLAMLFLGLLALTATFLLKDVKRVLLYAFAVFSVFDIQKALMVAHGKVSPGFTLYAPDVFFYPLLVLWLWDKMVIRRERFERPYGFTIALLSLAWKWETALDAPDIYDGALVAATFTKYFLVYYMLADMIRDAKTFRHVLVCFGAGLALTIMMASAQFITRSQLALQGAKPTSLGVNLTFMEAGTSAFRPGGFLHHPNALADYLVFVIPVLLAILFLGSRRVGSQVWWISAALMAGACGAMIVTLSRGGWIAGGVACLFVIFFGYRRGLVHHQQVMGILVTLLFGAGIVAILYPNAYYRIFLRDSRSTESRIAMIDQAWTIFKRNPVDGVGLGYYNAAAQFNIPQSFTRLNVGYQQKLLQGVCHNKYMLLAAEEGAVGLLLLLLLMLTFVYAFFSVKVWKDPVYCALGLGLCGGILGQAIFYAFDHFYQDVRIFLCWVAFGLIAALVKIHKTGRQKNSVPRAAD